jgi:hypothetical protein
LPLNPENLRDIRKRLEHCDRELDSIIQEFYAAPGAQNTGGNIGDLSRLHAQLVEQLAEEERKLEKKEVKKK